MQYVIMTVSDIDGNVIKYAYTFDRDNKYMNTESFFMADGGITISVYEDYEEFVENMATYSRNINCEYNATLL